MYIPLNCRKPSKEEKKIHLKNTGFDNESKNTEDISTVKGKVVNSECFDTDARTFDEYITY